MHFTIRFRLAETSNKYPYFGVFCRSANTRSLDQSISQPLMTRFNDCSSKTTYTDIPKTGAEPVTYVTGVRDRSLWRGRWREPISTAAKEDPARRPVSPAGVQHLSVAIGERRSANVRWKGLTISQLRCRGHLASNGTTCRRDIRLSNARL